MATINFPGLSTGIDTSTIITQIIDADSNIKNMYSDQVKTLQSEQEALTTFKSDLEALQTAAKNLADADDLKSFDVSTSDEDIVTADSTSSAGEGTHNIVVNQLAKADRWVQNTGSKNKEDYVGAGTFIYSYNGLETTLTTTTSTTLSDLVGLINNDASNPGVTASLLSYNNQYHLVLSGNSAGSEYGVSVNSSSTETLESDSELTDDGDNADTTTLLTNLDQFTGSFKGDETLVISGTDHNGNAITSLTLDLTSNTKISHILDAIEEAYDGNAKAVLDDGKIIVTDTISGESKFTISLTYNDTDNSATLNIADLTEASVGGETTASLSGFTASDFTRSQVAQDSKVTVDGYPATTAKAEVQQIAHSTAVTSGTFTLSYGGYTTAAIDYAATTDEIQAALEKLPSVQSGDITVSGDALDVDGTDKKLTFTFADTLGDVSGMLMDASNLSDDTLTITEATKGVDAYISRSSNTISDVVDGITFYLHGVSDEEGEEITITRNTDTLTTKLNALVTAYNTVATFIDDNTGYDTSTKTAGALMGDYTVDTVENQLFTSLVNNAKGFLSTVDDYVSPSQLGLSIDSSGQLSLDTDILDTAISDNYLDVLALLGATKTGSSSSSTINFYSASDNYTTAGEYDVKVTVSDGVITSAKVKMSDESDSAWRDMTISSNTVTGDSTFDSSSGYPVYNENALVLSVDTSTDGTYTSSVDVKQGFAGALEDALKTATKDTTGSIYVDNESIQDEIDSLQDRIDEETTRLAAEKTRLTTQYANLEATLTKLKSQLAEITGSTSS